MKILHVAESIKGGVGTYLNHVVPPQISELGVENIRVIVPREHIVQIPRIDGRCVRTFERPARSIGSLLKLRSEMVSCVREFRPELIHAHSTFAGGVVRLSFAVNPRSPRIVYCPHGWVFHTNLGKLGVFAAERAESILSRFCDIVVAISCFEKNEGVRVGVSPTKLRVVHNGLPLIAPPPIPLEWSDNRLRVLFIGRLDRQKGLDVLLEAVRPLTADVHVRAVGEAILSDAQSPDIPSNVEMMGWRREEEIEALLHSCDLVVMPSRWEGFGLAAIEAMRARRAVLASAVGGLPEVVEDGVTGRLFPADDPEVLRSLLVSLSRSDLQRMGEAGQQRFRRYFSVERTHRKLMEIYEELLSGQRISNQKMRAQSDFAG